MEIGGFPSQTNFAREVLYSAGPTILPQLARLLREAPLDQQAKAAYVMGTICYRQPDAPEVHDAVPTLTASAKSTSSEVRIYSIQALAAIGEAASSAILDMIQLTTDTNDGVRMSAVDALGRIGADSPESQAALTAAMSDTSADVRITAKKALEMTQINQK